MVASYRAFKAILKTSKVDSGGGSGSFAMPPVSASAPVAGNSALVEDHLQDHSHNCGECECDQGIYDPDYAIDLTAYGAAITFCRCRVAPY
jgi:hypothetical protein